MANTTVNDIIAYLKNLAVQHKSINHTDGEPHFTRMDIDELTSQLRTTLNFPAVICDSSEGILSDPLVDNINALWTIGFEVVDQLPSNDRGNYDAIQTILHNMFEIGMDFFTWMKADKNRGVRPMQTMDFNHVRWFQVGPELDGAYGYRFEFTFGNQQSFKFDATKWNTANPNVT